MAGDENGLSSGSLAICREDHLHMNSGTRKHVNQGIDAQKIDPPTDKIANPCLRDTKELGGIRLGKVAILNLLAYLNHES